MIVFEIGYCCIMMFSLAIEIVNIALTRQMYVYIVLTTLNRSASGITRFESHRLSYQSRSPPAGAANTESLILRRRNSNPTNECPSSK